jgi:hypothetical protein
MVLAAIYAVWYHFTPNKPAKPSGENQKKVIKFAVLGKKPFRLSKAASHKIDTIVAQSPKRCDLKFKIKPFGYFMINTDVYYWTGDCLYQETTTSMEIWFDPLFQKMTDSAYMPHCGDSQNKIFKKVIAILESEAPGSNNAEK